MREVVGMVSIEASILAADYARLGDQAREAEVAGVDAILSLGVEVEG